MESTFLYTLDMAYNPIKTSAGIKEAGFGSNHP
ncbi:hypothetical protein TRIP_B200659 [uncultured Desulfatiglans sp.]|nr:hypothetical protein TRIP_B200659 [uncultured Desulfatiglans sp.]